MFQSFNTVVTGVTLILVSVTLAVLATSLVGAFIGWVVGFFFPHTMYLLSTAMNIEAAPWQLGVMMGFVAGFFKHTTTVRKD